MLPRTIAFCSILLTSMKIFQCKLNINIAERFVNENITRDLNLTSVPNEICEAEYPNDVTVRGGNLLYREEIEVAPKLQWKTKESTWYTLFLLTPDFPSRWWNSMASWCSWFVGNIPGSDVCKGEAIVAYRKPFSLRHSGPRRWMFLIHEQPAFLNFSAEPRIAHLEQSFRGCFNYQKILDTYDLKQPAAVNYFWTDDGLNENQFVTEPPEKDKKGILERFKKIYNTTDAIMSMWGNITAL